MFGPRASRDLDVLPRRVCTSVRERVQRHTPTHPEREAPTHTQRYWETHFLTPGRCLTRARLSFVPRASRSRRAASCVSLLLIARVLRIWSGFIPLVVEWFHRAGRLDQILEDWTLRYESVNFGAGRSPGSLHRCAHIDCESRDLYRGTSLMKKRPPS